MLELPATGWLRRYRVRAHGKVDLAALEALREGITIDGIHYAGIEAKLDREQGSNAWITMGLREGKNREIKKVLEHLGLSVNRLIRVSFGPFELGELGEGEIAEVRTRVLREQLGAKLAKEAGANFEAQIETAKAPEAPAGPPTPGGGGGERQRRPSHRGDRAPEQKREGFRREATRRFGSEADRPREPLKPSVAERKRKHVSALRAEIAGDAGGNRKRIVRGATQDRKGREVAVERLTPTQATLRKRADAAAKTSRPRARFSAKGQGARGESGDRLAGRFGGAERSRDAAPQGRRYEARNGGAKTRPPRDDRPRGEGRPERFADKPVSGRKFKHRDSGAEARPRRDDRPRGERSTSGERPFTGRNKHQRAKRDDQRPGRAGARPEGAAGRPPRRGPPRDRPSPGGEGRGPRRPPRKP